MDRRRRAVCTVVLALGLAVFLAGCPKDPYTASTDASLKVSNAVDDALTAVKAVEQANLITQPEVASVASYLGSVTTLNTTFRNSARQLHASGQTGKAAYLTAAQTFVTAANDPALLSAIHISNPGAQAKVQTALTAIQTALTGIQTAINSAKGAS